MSSAQNVNTNTSTYLSEIVEVLIVTVLGFGLFIYSSTTAALSNAAIHSTQTYNTYDFVFMVVFEIIMLSIIAYYLKRRQYSINDFNLHFTFSMIGVAIVLVIVRFGLGALINKALVVLFNQKTVGDSSITFQSNLLSIILIVIVNSIYEELLLIGYYFKRFESCHPAIFIVISCIVRVSYHTYQGWSNVPMVLILALVFGIYYTKYQKLWPLIIAHGLGNIFHFLNMKYQWLEFS